MDCKYCGKRIMLTLERGISRYNDYDGVDVYHVKCYDTAKKNKKLSKPDLKGIKQGSSCTIF